MDRAAPAPRPCGSHLRRTTNPRRCLPESRLWPVPSHFSTMWSKVGPGAGQKARSRPLPPPTMTRTVPRMI
jgi:hypothetical protein